MISFSKESVFNYDFIPIYKNKVWQFISSRNTDILFFNHNLHSNNIDLKEFVEHIAFDPFSPCNTNEKIANFLKDYNEIAEFLLYSPKYFDVLKEQFHSKKGKGYRDFLHTERLSVCNKFSSNILLRDLDIEEPKNYKSERSYNNFYNKIKKDFIKNNVSISRLFDYNNFLIHFCDIRSEILNNINLSVCPYCNRQYIDTYSHNGKIKSIAQVDHFFPKSIFPLYSLSLLNFAPSCSHCNCIIKRDSLFPWEMIYNNEKNDEKYFQIKFYDLNGMLGDTSKFEIKINPARQAAKNNSIFFRHNEIYCNHKMDVSILLKKRALYTDGYKSAIESCLSTKISNEDFKKMIFGVSGNHEDFAKIPLSKFKHDILIDILHEKR